MHRFHIIVLDHHSWLLLLLFFLLLFLFLLLLFLVLLLLFLVLLLLCPLLLNSTGVCFVARLNSLRTLSITLSLTTISLSFIRFIFIPLSPLSFCCSSIVFALVLLLRLCGRSARHGCWRVRCCSVRRWCFG